MRIRHFFFAVFLGAVITGLAGQTSSSNVLAPTHSLAQTNSDAPSSSRTPDETVECEILVVGGGLAGSATAYEALLAGRTVCMTEITDWVGGQITAQGTSALDEAKMQRSLLFYAHGYNELRQRIEDKYNQLNPGDCWVSVSCFLPTDANEILWEQLQEAAEEGEGELKWFPSTVIKELELNADGTIIEGAIAIQHTPAPNTPPLNTEPLSQTIEDAYRYEDSDRFTKTIIRFVPLIGETEEEQSANPASRWFVIDATETGELIALADVPYRLGLDPLSYLNPSSPTETGDPYCTQGFTYTFAMEQTEEPQPQEMPSFYPEYEPYYSYEKPRENINYFDFVFTYRRIWSPKPRSKERVFGVSQPKPGDISMQNWTWGNDYRPGTSQDNLIYSRDQLQAVGQLEPGGWLGGLRTETLQKGEENALGYYYWLVAGTTDSQLGEGIKQPAPNHRFLAGFDAPMGTEHGLSKYPYIREGRRIIGRSSYGYREGFMISELDISRVDYLDPYYQQALPPQTYRQLWIALAGLETATVIRQDTPPDQISRRTRSTIYPDAVGIAQYAIDFHPCMTLSPPEAPGNTEREGVRRSHGQAYPAQIPLRAMIPQKINNMLVAGKSIATSSIAAAAYRVHSFEWSAGSAAGTTASFALSEGILPYELVDNLPAPEPLLEELQQQLEKNGNPIAFPDTSVFNLNWEDWTVW
ncbi:MAG: FAD-dependent oxidoreductase [Cyanobacteria bacterium CRU_2_1]|nr:FAD-dependent oxidoreductase [Cyanobacteria bacterium RU_5_0]NJR57672.1 FAD-dependent oxidoreductase [Cyanobacteria bacterium CRU_2_1]